jgi:hypothetical protein
MPLTAIDVVIGNCVVIDRDGDMRVVAADRMIAFDSAVRHVLQVKSTAGGINKCHVLDRDMRTSVYVDHTGVHRCGIRLIDGLVRGIRRDSEIPEVDPLSVSRGEPVVAGQLSKVDDGRDQDGNESTERDAGWTSLNPTPMHPEYP